MIVGTGVGGGAAAKTTEIVTLAEVPKGLTPVKMHVSVPVVEDVNVIPLGIP